MLQSWDGAGRNFQLLAIPSSAASIVLCIYMKFSGKTAPPVAGDALQETTSLGNREMETFVWMETTWEMPRVFLLCPFSFPCQDMGCWVIQIIHTASRGIPGLNSWKTSWGFSGYFQSGVKRDLRFQWDGDCRGNICSGGGVGAGFIPNFYLQLLTLSHSALPAHSRRML